MTTLPSFSLAASDGKTYTQTDFADGEFVIYLYPKDDTPGCTLESIAFENLSSQFADLGLPIFGLSKDSVASHEKFCAKHGMKFPLLSDPDCVLIEGLGSWVEKSMFGKAYMGIDRSTFIIRDGKMVHAWRKVKASGHAEDVLKWCQEEL